MKDAPKGLNLELRPEIQVSLETRPEVSLDKIRKEWIPRYHTLGPYVTGPSSWIDEIKLNVNAKQKFEREEVRLSKNILSVFDKIYPRQKGPPLSLTQEFNILVIATGPDGRRILEYMERCRERGGHCYGIDALKEHIDHLQAKLREKGLGLEQQKFHPALATELTTIFSEEMFDVITWERIGNHLLDDREWLFALRHEVTSLLKPGGRLLVAETLLDLNPKRKFKPSSSKPRTLEQYIQVLEPALKLEPEHVRHCKFAGDNYFIGTWKKQ